jgi:hypothetical protein
MSDYLNNIVMRSLSIADVVQPRVPHLFEQTTSAPVEAEPFSGAESTPQTVVAAGEADQPWYALTPMSQVNPEGTVPFFEQFRPPPLVGQPAAPAPILHAPSLPAPEGTRTNTEPAEVNESPIRVREVPPQAPAMQQRRTASQNAGRVADSVVPSRVGPTQFEPLTTIRKGAPSSDKTNASISPGMPAALAQHIRTERQPPPIKISIGRVDVRAIMPAGPAKAAVSTRPKPSLSLESYLKQREEGKR